MVPHSNFSSICKRFRDIAAFVLQSAIISHPTSSLPKISPCSPGSRWMAFGLRRAKVFGYLSMRLVSKISNVCDPDPPTLQTDRQTDDMRSQYRALHLSASRGKKQNETVRFLSMPPAESRCQRELMLLLLLTLEIAVSHGTSAVCRLTEIGGRKCASQARFRRLHFFRPSI